MGFDEKAELKSTEARIWKRAGYKKSQEDLNTQRKAIKVSKHMKEENIKRPKENHKGTQNESDRNY